MKYSNHLKRMNKFFTIHKTYETTIKDLAEILDCSERHVKTVVRYLDNEGYITWSIQRGRGKKPSIVLNYSLDELELEEAKQYIRKGQYKEGFAMLEKMEGRIQLQFQEWMTSYIASINKSEEDLDILRYPFYETRLVMDPLHAISRHDAHMVKQIFDRLVDFDAETRQVVPQIAHHFESEDGKTWTFYLRKGVLFHHGKELTSEDVKASLTRMMPIEAPLQTIDQILCQSKYVVEFQLQEINYLFPRYLASLKASIIPMDIIDSSNFQDFPIGCGPYQLVRHDDEMIILEVFKDYYGYRPWLDHIEIIKTPFPSDVSVPILLSPPDASWKAVERIEEGADFIMFNCRKSGLLQNEGLREKIYRIIRPEEFCLPVERVADSFMTERKGKRQPSHDFSKVTFAGEIKIAAQQIREGVNHLREAEILKEQLNQNGIQAKVEAVHVNDLKDRRVLERYDLIVSGVALGEDRLLSLISTLTSKRIPIFNCLVPDMQQFVLEQLENIKGTDDDGERMMYYKKIEDYLTDHHVIRFLTHRSHIVYESNDHLFVNMTLDSNGRIDYRKVWKRG